MWTDRPIEPEDLSSFAPPGTDLGTLAGRCFALLSQQERAWPRLRQGVEALARIRQRHIDLNAWPVMIQFNPARAASSLADVAPAAIARRPCFLCAENLPPEQRGIRRGRYVLLANPAPIVRGHLTLVYERHVPQELMPNVDDLLRIVADLGESFTIFYNGPRCGASAPDHMHFQAAPAGQMPIEPALESGVCLHERRWPAGTWGRVLADSADASRRTRCVITLSGADETELSLVMRQVLDRLPRPDDGGEPLVNLLARRSQGRTSIILFPRLVHRPRCYFAEGPDRILLSPGVMDMAGLVITVRAEDYERAGADLIAAMYREITLPADRVIASAE